jgi:hypothetical protein
LQLLSNLVHEGVHDLNLDTLLVLELFRTHLLLHVEHTLHLDLVDLVTVLVDLAVQMLQLLIMLIEFLT